MSLLLAGVVVTVESNAWAVECSVVAVVQDIVGPDLSNLLSTWQYAVEYVPAGQGFEFSYQAQIFDVSTQCSGILWSQHFSCHLHQSIMRSCEYFPCNKHYVLEHFYVQILVHTCILK